MAEYSEFENRLREKQKQKLLDKVQGLLADTLSSTSGNNQIKEARIATSASYYDKKLARQKAELDFMEKRKGK